MGVVSHMITIYRTSSSLIGLKTVCAKKHFLNHPPHPTPTPPHTPWATASFWGRGGQREVYDFGKQVRLVSAQSGYKTLHGSIVYIVRISWVCRQAIQLPKMEWQLFTNIHLTCLPIYIPREYLHAHSCLKWSWCECISLLYTLNIVSSHTAA